LEERKNTVTQHIDSAKQNLATTYVNAFVNAAYGKDLLMTSSGTADKDSWIYKNKEGGMLAAAASLGMTLLWDIDEGLSQIDKYMEAGDDHIVAGSYIAIGIVNSGIKNETDPVFAILLEKLESPKQIHKIGALIGLSLAYAGSARADLLEAISPIVLDSSNTLELQSVAALAIGLIYVGTCDEDAAQSILQTLMEKEQKDLEENSFVRLFALGLGLLFLGK
jgi:26S proteasome regulatory subunit N1